MPIQFPDNPSVNETHSVNGRTYIWTGQKWRRRRPRIEYVPPTMEVVNDFAAGSVLKVDADTESVGIGTLTPNAGDALTVGGDTTVDGHINVYSSLTVGASAGFSGDVDVSGNLVVDGYITVPTQVAGTNDTKVATTEYVTNAIAGLVGGAPAALDTLNELAAALDNDASYATSITNALSLKLDSSSYTAADVLAKLITVDGTGSSLDADTLDGSHASAFAASAHTHSYLPLSGGTLTGELVITGSAPQMKFNDAEHDDFWIHVNANNFYILPDRGDDGSWETPYALQLEADTNKAYVFGSEISTVGHTHSYAATSHTHSYVPTSGGSVTGNFTTQGNLYVGKNGGGDSIIYFYDDNSNAWREFFWDDSENRFRTSHNMKLSGYLHAGTEMYVGDDGGGDSWVHFYDDNSNTWRTFGWDDSANNFYAEGGINLNGTLNLTGSMYMTGLHEVNASKNSEIRIRSTFSGNWTAGDGFGHLTFYSNDTSGTGAGIRARLSAVSRDTYGLETDVKIFSMSAGSYAERIRIGAYGFVAFGNGLAPSERIHASGNILVTGTGYKPGGGSWTASSDERLKKNIGPYNSGLSTLRQLNPVTFVWDCDDIDDSGKVQVGVLAQDIETVWPDWVDTIENRSYVRNSDGQELTNTKAVSFKNDFNVMVVSAIKELAERIEALEAN